MKKRLLFVFICLIAIAAVQSQAITATPRTPDEKALSMLLSAYAETVNAGDPEAWITLWDTDGIQLPFDAPMNIGRSAIWKMNKDDFGAIDMKFSIVQHEIVAFGDYGYVRGTYSYSFKSAIDAQPISFAGKYLTICRRQTDGTWRIYRDAFNADAL